MGLVEESLGKKSPVNENAWSVLSRHRRAIRLRNLALVLKSKGDDQRFRRLYESCDKLIPDNADAFLDFPNVGGLLIPEFALKLGSTRLLNKLSAAVIGGAAISGVNLELPVVLEGGETIAAFPYRLAVRNNSNSERHLILRSEHNSLVLKFESKEFIFSSNEEETSSKPDVWIDNELQVVFPARVVGIIIDAVDPVRITQNPQRFLDDETAFRPNWINVISAACDTLHQSQQEGFLREIRTVLQTIVPAQDTESVFSSTSGAMTGRAVITLDNQASDVAEMIVHEVQHSKLSALEDFEPVINADDSPDLVSPWRTDPRPASGLLHGCYSFQAVAEYWDSMQSTQITNPVLANTHVWQRKHEVIQGLKRLFASGRLTSAGVGFLRGIEERANALHPVRPESTIVDLVKASRNQREWARAVENLLNLKPRGSLSPA